MPWLLVARLSAIMVLIMKDEQALSSTKNGLCHELSIDEKWYYKKGMEW